MLFNALNQNLVQFELKPGVQVIVYVTQLTLGECLLGFRGKWVSWREEGGDSQQILLHKCLENGFVAGLFCMVKIKKD